MQFSHTVEDPGRFHQSRAVGKRRGLEWYSEVEICDGWKIAASVPNTVQIRFSFSHITALIIEDIMVTVFEASRPLLLGSPIYTMVTDYSTEYVESGM